MSHPLDRIGNENAVERGKITKALSEIFFELRAGEADIKTVGELNNTAGKVWKSHALDLAEAYYLNERAPGTVPQLTNGDA